MDRTRDVMVGLAAVGAGLLVFILVVLLSSFPLVAGVAGGLAAAVSVVAVVLLTWPSKLVQPPSDTARQRDTLVQALAELVPQMPAGLVWQATNALTAVGVREVIPDGMRADPQDHQVVGTEVTTDTTVIDVVARTVKPGYTDGDRIVVYPKVVVYAEKKP